MQTQRSGQNKGPKYLDTKVLIASLSIAVTVGLWNLFSNEAVLAQKVEPNPESSPPEAPAEGQDLPPLPTLVPLLNLSSVQSQGSSSGIVAQQANPAQPVGLRSVTAPDQVIVQKVKPVFEEGKIAPSGGGSSRRGAVTQTRSSR